MNGAIQLAPSRPIGLSRHVLHCCEVLPVTFNKVNFNASVAGNAERVNLLYGNVVGTAPSADEFSYFTELLDSGAYTPAGLGVPSADTVLDQANIGLRGLAEMGIEYL